MEQLMNDIRELIVESLNLEDIQAREIGPDEPLFGEGLGLDSIDALELVLALERTFQIKINSDDETKKLFSTVRSLASLVERERSQG